MSIQYRHNIMNIGSVSTFARVRGRYSQGNRDVYFLRAVGGNDALADEIREIDQLLGAAMDRRQLLYKRITALPNDLSGPELDFYLHACETWLQSDGETIQIQFENGNQAFCKALSAALQTVAAAYDRLKPGNTPSMKRNFIIKLLGWTDFVLKDNPLPWSEQICMKIVADNVTKVQEYLFYYMLTLIGADVVLLQTKKDIELPDWLAAYSKKLTLGEFVNWELPKYVCAASAVQSTAIPAQTPTQGSAPSGAAQSTGKIQMRIPQRERRSQPSQAPAPVQAPTSPTPPTPVQAAKPAAPVRPVSAGRGGPEPRREKTFEELALLASSVVMISIHDDQGEVMGSGSGIMIGKDGYILTNFHVVRGGCFYSVNIEDDDTVYRTNELIKYHAVEDMAIIRIPRKLNPLPLYRGTEKLVRGQRVVAIGSPLGLFNSVSDGIISGFRTIDSVDMLQFTAPTSPGSSGGAILNMFGEVIGISTAGIDRGQNINLAVSYASISPFIRGFCS